jgi:hypothetical protein
MRIMIVAFALGTTLAMCSPGAFITEALAKPKRIIIVTPKTPQPYWDSYIVPRYRYRPEDDRVDPCGGPVVPVIRYGPQEVTVPLWLANGLGLDRVHGRDWPCKGRSR